MSDHADTIRRDNLVDRYSGKELAEKYLRAKAELQQAQEELAERKAEIGWSDEARDTVLAQLQQAQEERDEAQRIATNALNENGRLRVGRQQAIDALTKAEADLWEFDKVTLDDFNFADAKQQVFGVRVRIQAALVKLG